MQSGSVAGSGETRRAPAIPLGRMVRLLGFGCLVMAACWSAIELPRELGRVTPICMANALTLALLLSLPRRRWPIWLATAWVGNLAADVLTGDRLGMALTLSLCNTVEISLAGLLLRRFVGSRPNFSRMRDLVLFTAIAGVVAPLVSATLAAWVLGQLRGINAAFSLTTWAAADGLGALIAVPVLLTLRNLPRHLAATPVKPAGWLSLAALAVTTIGVFSVRQPLVFLVLPALMLVIFQLELLGAALGVLMVVVVAMAFTLAGLGPMNAVHVSVVERVLVAQAFLAAITLTGFPTAAVLAHRRRLQGAVAQAAARTAEQYRRVKLAEEIAGVGYWRMDVATGRLSWSDAMFTAFALPPGPAPDGAAVMARVHPDDRAQESEALAQAMAMGADYSRDTRLVWPDGQVRHIISRTSFERDADGAVTTLFGTLIDVTDLKRAQEEVAASEARYRLVTESSRDTVLKCDKTSAVLYASQASRLFGYEPDDLIGRNCFELIHPDDVEHTQRLMAGLFADSVAHRASNVSEYRVRAADGAYVWVEGNPSLIRDADGEAVAFVDCLRDITRRKAMEAELHAAKEAAEAAAAVKGEFLANMSHELRTPLTSVLGFTRLALDQPELLETTRGYIAKASNAGAALLSTVNDILDFSKLESGQLQIRQEPCDPTRICAETLELFSAAAAAKGVTLRFAPGEVPDSLSIDPNRLRQLLLNLVGNAVKFSDDGEVRLDLDWSASDGRLRVSIQDHGPGIAPDQQSLLFRRFSQVDGSSTRRHGGTGLGLAICMGLVEAMGGEIGVESELSQGARFFFEIPAPRATATLADALAEGPMFAAGVRVLVADDHAVNRELVRAVLVPLGAELTEASNGAEAVARAGEAPFDLILMDLRMPEMDGLAAMQAIRRGDGPNRSAPILAFSAGADAPGAAERRQAGFDGDLAKPVMPADLVNAVSRHTCGWDEDDVAEHHVA